MLRIFRRRAGNTTVSETELARRLSTVDYRCTCCDEPVHLRHGPSLRPLGWADPPAPAPDEALDQPGDVLTENYARRGRDMLLRATLPLAIKGTDGHVMPQVWANLSTGDFARFRAAQGRGEADRLGDLAAWLYVRIPASSGPVLNKGVIVPVAGGHMPVFWITDLKHPLHAAQHHGGLSAQEVIALYRDLGATTFLQHLMQ